MLCPYSMVFRVGFDTQGTFEMPATQVAIQAVILLRAFGIMSGIVLVSSDRASHDVPTFDGLAS
jgi:hypothetical protein